MRQTSLSKEGASHHQAVTLQPEAADSRFVDAPLAGKMLLDEQGVAVLRVPGFFDADRCRQILDVLRQVRHEGLPSPNLDSDMYTLGITQGSHANRGPDEYFNKLQAWANDPAFAAVTGKNSAPMRSIHGFFQEAFARPVEPAKQGGRELGQGVIRAIDYVGPHVDDVSLHSNWDVNRLRHQFAWNLYLSVGEHGGQTVVYGRTLDSKVDLRTAPQLRMMPSVGELIVFNSRLVHEVLVSSPAKRRISINGMFSPKPRGQQDIVTWS